MCRESKRGREPTLSPSLSHSLGKTKKKRNLLESPGTFDGRRVGLFQARSGPLFLLLIAHPADGSRSPRFVARVTETPEEGTGNARRKRCNDENPRFVFVFSLTSLARNNDLDPFFLSHTHKKTGSPAKVTRTSSAAPAAPPRTEEEEEEASAPCSLEPEGGGETRGRKREEETRPPPPLSSSLLLRPPRRRLNLFSATTTTTTTTPTTEEETSTPSSPASTASTRRAGSPPSPSPGPSTSSRYSSPPRLPRRCCSSSSGRRSPGRRSV